jgi:ubiquinone biosynthesis protein Coq4
MARTAPCLIGVELEKYWTWPLQDVRSKLGLAAANAA